MTSRKMQQIRMFAGGAILVRPRCDHVVVRFRSAPEWWRGTKPVPFPETPARAALRGVVSQADIPSFAAPPAELQPLGFEQAQARGLTISLDDRHLWSAWSEFDDCTFSQRRSGRVLNEEGAAAQGSFGNRPSIYRSCRFEGVRFKNLGGYSMGDARFQDCTFDRCHFNGHFHHSADLISCRFLGEIDGCVWNGAASPDDGGRRNIIHGNDFTAAVIRPNVAWRENFDLAAQHWPSDFHPLVDD